MAQSECRGYILLCGADYIRKTASEARARELLDGLSPKTKEELATAKHAGWSPLKAVSEVHRAVAALGEGNDAVAQQHLIACGKFTSAEASSTFLKLFMKLLTPTMFSKKLPDLWRRDCNVGRFVVEVKEDRIRNHVHDLTEWAHITPLASGFVSFALEAMGKTVAKQEIHGWSLGAPTEPNSWFDVIWRN